ncbi:MAG: ParB/RepB/Spo0J family partition protein [Candidatus Omnitrophota bacterium]|nr:ParB/RepB/Spo0J family partition protein [Candidatus Omnitrophota bacterium]
MSNETRRALGRGLSALIPEKVLEKPELKEEIKGMVNLKIEQIMPNPYQPREEFNAQALEELAASIKEKGFIQPIIVRKSLDGKYELIAGERRLRAANLLRCNEIPAIIKEVNDEESLELALIENIQREDLNPLEEAQAYQKLVDRFGFTQEKIAQVVGKARATINNALRILKLPAKIQESIKKNLLSFSHARALLEIENKEEQQVLADKIISSELSVRELENILKHKRREKNKKPKAAALQKEPHAVAVEEELQHILCTKVRIMQAKKRGRIEIEFYSPEDLERILGVLLKKK